MDEAQEARLKRGRDRLLRELRIIQADAGLSDIELVALVGFAAGAALAGIDPSKASAEYAIELVWRNINAGNKAALNMLAQGRRN